MNILKIVRSRWRQISCFLSTTFQIWKWRFEPMTFKRDYWHFYQSSYIYVGENGKNCSNTCKRSLFRPYYKFSVKTIDGRSVISTSESQLIETFTLGIISRPLYLNEMKQKYAFPLGKYTMIYDSIIHVFFNPS